MTAAVFKAMLLGFLRDRGALVLSFLLPPLFFVIFAAIFASAGGEELSLRFVIVDERQTEASQRLVAALADDPSLVVVMQEPPTAEAAHEAVRSGRADIGLVIRSNAAPLTQLGGDGAPPFVLLVDPARGVAAPVVTGQVQRAYFSKLPDISIKAVADLIGETLVTYTEQQQAEIATGVGFLRDQADQGEETQFAFDTMFERQDVAGVGQGGQAANNVAYYAGAVAVLFLLFSAANGAISLLEENETGVLDRVLAAPGGLAALINGKFLFLTFLGALQATLIFVIAWLGYGVPFIAALALWLPTTVVTAAAASGLCLALASACRTRRQAQTLATILILILSALGGSMIPRFLMPDAFRDLGWLTPNAWALEAYTAIFWRNAPAAELFTPWAVLAASALAGLGAAHLLARRFA